MELLTITYCGNLTTEYFSFHCNHCSACAAFRSIELPFTFVQTGLVVSSGISGRNKTKQGSSNYPLQLNAVLELQCVIVTSSH